MSVWPPSGCGTRGTRWRIWRIVQLAGGAGKGSTTARRSALPSSAPVDARHPTLVLPSAKLSSCSLGGPCSAMVRVRIAPMPPAVERWRGARLPALVPQELATQRACRQRDTRPPANHALCRRASGRHPCGEAALMRSGCSGTAAGSQPCWACRAAGAGGIYAARGKTAPLDSAFSDVLPRRPHAEVGSELG